METANIVAAPQLIDVPSALALWKKERLGSDNDFYTLITRPSAQRAQFLAKLAVNTSLCRGGVVVNTYSHGTARD